MVKLQHPIQVVARLTGLSPHVIRVWEKRYKAVTPARTDSNRRLYSDEDVERLQWLARATEVGHKIGIIAKLGLEDLKRLGAAVGMDGAAVVPAPTRPNGVEDEGAMIFREPREARGGEGRGLAGRMPAGGVHGFESGGDAEAVREAVRATIAFQGEGLMRGLESAVVRWGHNGMLHRVVCPLAREIGERWQRGEITAAHEHFASGIIRDFLARMARPFPLGDAAPRAVVTTPAGQLHELGAVIVAAAAGNLGWRTTYLGASLPAAEIAGATKQNRARLLLLSIVYPGDDPRLGEELMLLRRLLPSEVDIVVGGRSCTAYATPLKSIGAMLPGDLEELCALLEDMRHPRGEICPG